MTRVFPIDPASPQVRLVPAIIVRVSVSGVIVVIGCYVTGIIDLTTSLIVLAVGAFQGTVIPWIWARQLRGTIEITDDGIQVKTHQGTTRFPWAHIRSVRVGKAGEAGGRGMKQMMFLLGQNADYPCVAVELDRWIHVRRNPFLLNRWGTAEKGVPLFVSKAVLFPLDPHRFLSETEDAMAEASDRLRNHDSAA
ncbi:MAG: PH domain-containing protein [Dehalococcoidia bacterium]